MKYILSYRTRFGTISAESDDPEELVLAYDELRRLAKSIPAPANTRIRKPSKRAPADSKLSPNPRLHPPQRTIGTGETSTIIRIIESRLLGTRFFSKPRTTGEMREKLRELTRKDFTSRKVSQALGILAQKRLLRRSGSRNFYSYSTF